MSSIADMVRRGGLFQGYAYGYPHKTAYRPLQPAVPLREIWDREDKSGLFLYAHVPFCGVRCGFCNLFTTTGEGAAPGRVSRYLDALDAQAEVLSDCLGNEARISRIAIGGGTPTFLDVDELGRLFRTLDRFTRNAGDIPIAVEMSPDSVDDAKLAWLRERGVTRASLGVQSFVSNETRALGRPQNPEKVTLALQAMRRAAFPIRNIDLIYGMEGQDWPAWRTSLEETWRHEPEEIFLYPLYVRPLTGLGRKGRTPADAREDLYRRGRDWLLSRGCEQVSMRLFRGPSHPGACGVHYCCQEDGMIGLGAGARSYTRALHYSTEWAVGRAGVREILDHFTERCADDHAQATHGAWLDDDEQRRRYVIKSVLRAEGLDLAAYRERFGADALADLPQLRELLDAGAATLSSDRMKPTMLGLEWSDVIGPWLYSDQVRQSIREYDMR